MMKFWTPAAVQQHKDLPQDSFPQQNVNPGVQDLVPRSHTYSHQKSIIFRLVLSSGAQHDDVELVQSSKTEKHVHHYIAVFLKASLNVSVQNLAFLWIADLMRGTDNFGDVCRFSKRKRSCSFKKWENVEPYLWGSSMALSAKTNDVKKWMVQALAAKTEREIDSK